MIELDLSTYKGSIAVMGFGAFFFACSRHFRHVFASEERFLKHGGLIGTKSFRRAAFNIFGPGIYYMSFPISVFGALLFLSGLAAMLLNFIGLI